jgi:hypothetical protein
VAKAKKATQASKAIQDWYTNRLREFYSQYYRASVAFDNEETEEDPEEAYPRATELSPTAGKPNRAKLPQEVRDAYTHYKKAVEDEDLGSVQVYRVSTDGPVTYAVRVRTDGDDGYLEIYDESGDFLAAGRTYLEIVAWGTREWLRAQVGQAFPPEITDAPSRTLWGKPLPE